MLAANMSGPDEGCSDAILLLPGPVRLPPPQECEGWAGLGRRSEPVEGKQSSVRGAYFSASLLSFTFSAST